MSFKDLGLGEKLLKAISDAGYTEPTPIQAESIPAVLMTRDVVGLAQTGTGKTASFILPMIEILGQGRARARMPRSLVLAPTRELAMQIADNFDKYGKNHKLVKAVLTGGTSIDPQIKLLERGVDVLIATPGRLLDLFDRGNILLADIKILVIDEADRMMDMGFIPDLEKIVSKLPPMRQTLLFSATMPPEIKKLSEKFLMNPKRISVAPPSSPTENVSQYLVECSPRGKRKALFDVIKQEKVKNAFVFCNRKRDIAGLMKAFRSEGYNAGEMHGDMNQTQRVETLKKFKADEITFLICSDVAARGLDVKAMSHVFNFDVPANSEDYVHRIGRTGRAGEQGRAFTFATKADDKYVNGIERLIDMKIERLDPRGGSIKKQDAKQDDQTDDKKDTKKDDKKDDKKSEKQDEKKSGKKSSPKPSKGKKDDHKKQSSKPKSSDKQKSGKSSRQDNKVLGFGEDMPAFFQEKK